MTKAKKLGYFSRKAIHSFLKQAKKKDLLPKDPENPTKEELEALASFGKQECTSEKYSLPMALGIAGLLPIYWTKQAYDMGVRYIGSKDTPIPEGAKCVDPDPPPAHDYECRGNCEWVDNEGNTHYYGCDGPDKGHETMYAANPINPDSEGWLWATPVLILTMCNYITSLGLFAYFHNAAKKMTPENIKNCLDDLIEEENKDSKVIVVAE